MKRLGGFLAFLLLALLIGCGGGGGGGGGTSGGSGGGPVTLVGVVLDVNTGGPLSTAPSVQTSAQTVQAGADGSFTVSAPANATQVQINTSNGDGTFTYTFPAASGTTDLGNLWVGPQRISVTGTVVDSTSGLPVGSAVVSFAGRQVTAGLNGTFTLSQVAYSNANTAAFFGIEGSVNVANYYLLNFSAAGQTAVGGVLNLGDLLVTPTSDPNPPGTPYSITGIVEPVGASAGTIVTLKQAGTAIRIFNVGADGHYQFWVGPGSYTITYVKQTKTAPTQSVTVQSLSSTVTVPNVTLH